MRSFIDEKSNTEELNEDQLKSLVQNTQKQIDQNSVDDENVYNNLLNYFHNLKKLNVDKAFSIMYTWLYNKSFLTKNREQNFFQIYLNVINSFIQEAITRENNKNETYKIVFGNTRDLLAVLFNHLENHNYLVQMENSLIDIYGTLLTHKQPTDFPTWLEEGQRNKLQEKCPHLSILFSLHALYFTKPNCLKNKSENVITKIRQASPNIRTSLYLHYVNAVATKVELINELKENNLIHDFLSVHIRSGLIRPGIYFVTDLQKIMQQLPVNSDQEKQALKAIAKIMYENGIPILPVREEKTTLYGPQTFFSRQNNEEKSFYFNLEDEDQSVILPMPSTKLLEKQYIPQ